MPFAILARGDTERGTSGRFWQDEDERALLLLERLEVLPKLPLRAFLTSSGDSAGRGLDVVAGEKGGVKSVEFEELEVNDIDVLDGEVLRDADLAVSSSTPASVSWSGDIVLLRGVGRTGMAV